MYVQTNESLNLKSVWSKINTYNHHKSIMKSIQFMYYQSVVTKLWSVCHTKLLYGCGRLQHNVLVIWTTFMVLSVLSYLTTNDYYELSSDGFFFNLDLELLGWRSFIVRFSVLEIPLRSKAINIVLFFYF